MNRYNKSVTKLASMLKERDNPISIGAITGEVTEAPPNLKIKIENNIILNKNKLIISEEKTDIYKREFESTIEFEVDNETSTEQADGHIHQIKKLKAKGIMKGDISWVDTLKAGDMVLLLPANGDKIFYIIDKVVML